MLYEAQIDSRVEEKLSELKELHEAKAKVLSKRLNESEEERRDLESKLLELTLDFKHNLEIIAEKENIIEMMKQAFEEVKSIVFEKNSQIESLEEAFGNLKNESTETIEELKFELREAYDKLSEGKRSLKAIQNEEKERIHFLEKEIAVQKENQIQFLSLKEEFKSKSQECEILQKSFRELEIQVKSLSSLNEKLSFELKRARDSETAISESFQKSKEEFTQKLEEATHAWIEKEAEMRKRIQDLQLSSKQIEINFSQAKKELDFMKTHKDSSDSFYSKKFEEYDQQVLMLKEKKLKMKNKLVSQIEELKSSELSQTKTFSAEKETLKSSFLSQIKSLEIEIERLKLEQGKANEKLATFELAKLKAIEASERTANELKSAFENEKRELKISNESLLNKLQSIQESKAEIARKNDLLQASHTQLKNKLSEFEKENQMLMREILELRKRIKSPRKELGNQMFLGEFSEKESIEEAFSGDLGPASPIKISKQKLSSLPQMTNSSKLSFSQLQILVKDLQEENERQKFHIETMTKAMEDSKNIVSEMNEKNLQLSNQLKTANEANFKFQTEILELKNRNFSLFEELKLTTETISQLKSLNEVHLDSNARNTEELEAMKLQKEKDSLELNSLKANFDKLSKERDKLLEISSSLRAKLNKSENSTLLENIQVLEQQIRIFQQEKSQLQLSAQEEITKWKFLSQKKDEALARLKNSIGLLGNFNFESNVFPNNEKSQLEDKSFKESWQDFLTDFDQIEKSLEELISRKQPEEEKKSQPIMNSVKKVQKQKVRNYNIKDDNQIN